MFRLLLAFIFILWRLYNIYNNKKYNDHKRLLMKIYVPFFCLPRNEAIIHIFVDFFGFIGA